MTLWQPGLARREALLDEVRAVVIDVLQLAQEPDELDPDAPLFGGGLRLDSIDALDLIVRLEAGFGVIVIDRDASPAESARAMRTLNTLVDRLLAAGA